MPQFPRSHRRKASGPPHLYRSRSAVAFTLRGVASWVPDLAGHGSASWLGSFALEEDRMLSPIRVSRIYPYLFNDLSPEPLAASSGARLARHATAAPAGNANQSGEHEIP
jgi:hypothetical protein